MATLNKGVYWVDAEVEFMLKILHQESVGRRVMTSTHMETLSVFEVVISGLEKERAFTWAGKVKIQVLKIGLL